MINLLTYPNAAISAATKMKLDLHMSYLSEELVVLNLSFQFKNTPESKKLMLAAME